jgi:hypothetical protein
MLRDATGCYGMKWESKESSVIARLLFIRFLGKGSCAAGLLRKQCRAGMPSGAFEHGRGQVSSPELSRHCSFDPSLAVPFSTALESLLVNMSWRLWGMESIECELGHDGHLLVFL